MYRILIVDDEPMIVEGLCALFEEQDAVQLEVYKACLAAEALGIMNRRRIDILLTDIRMPAVSGIELMQRVRANWPACRIIFLTAFEEFEYAYAALKNPGVRFLLKTGQARIYAPSAAGALSNIYRRLRIVFGDACAMRAARAGRGGLRIEIEIPAACGSDVQTV